MTRRASYWLPAFLFAAVLILASYGTGGGAQGSTQGGSQGGSDDSGGKTSGEKSGMGMEETTGGMGSMKGMDKGSMNFGDMAAMSRKMVMPNGKYSDKAFIDAMVPHHKSAIAMAQVDLDESDDPEIRSLAEDIVSAPEA